MNGLRIVFDALIGYLIIEWIFPSITPQGRIGWAMVALGAAIVIEIYVFNAYA